MQTDVHIDLEQFVGGTKMDAGGAIGSPSTYGIT
jgi:hypothetical protein